MTAPEQTRLRFSAIERDYRGDDSIARPPLEAALPAGIDKSVALDRLRKAAAPCKSTNDPAIISCVYTDIHVVSDTYDEIDWIVTLHVDGSYVRTFDISRREDRDMR